MQWPRAGVTSKSRTPHCRHSRARCSFLSPSPLGGRGKGEGGRWRHLEPLGAFPLSLRLRLRGASPPLLDPLPRWGRGIRKRRCATRVPAAMQWPRAGVTSSSRAPHRCHSRARCSPLLSSSRAVFVLVSLSPWGREEGEGGCWRHLEPLGASPLSLRLRLRGASPPLLDPLPRRGRGIRKRGSVPHLCHSPAVLTAGQACSC